MKGQDILLLFKLVSLEEQELGDESKKIQLNVTRRFDELEAQEIREESGHYIDIERSVKSVGVQLSDALDWQGWDDEPFDVPPVNTESYTVRGLAAALGLGKSEISSSLKRCREVGLVISYLEENLPRVNRRGLLDLVTHGLKYFFPARPGAIVRGIPTAFAAPILEGKLMSAGELIPVWPSAQGKKKGQAITPIYKTVPQAVKSDYLLYHYLALVDGVRIGSPREAEVASSMLRKWILHE